MSTYFQRSTVTNVLFFIIGLVCSIHSKEEITCYVCTPHLNSSDTEVSEDYFTFEDYNTENIPNCGSSSGKNFVLKCPEGYKGCLTIIYGENTLKSCNELAISDCKIANGIEYCFCDHALCNNATQNSITSDDEDVDDGSGQDNQIQLNENINKNYINTKIILNNTSVKNISLTKTSAAKLLLPKNFNILGLLIIYTIL
ncbi:uncharacterized protein LOC112684839 [Sipha flava]|uniref:Uncharacterized protein LOC112684839 n=1 Tax=Sipha flava TaxID=143950 RepID=A0A2S2R3N4_9HEMI|nr:uncharacterized protein LOC112684839 [Sipha flava]